MVVVRGLLFGVCCVLVTGCSLCVACCLIVWFCYFFVVCRVFGRLLLAVVCLLVCLPLCDIGLCVCVLFVVCCCCLLVGVVCGLLVIVRCVLLVGR